MTALLPPQASSVEGPLIPTNEELDFQNQHMSECNSILKRIVPEILAKLGQTIVEFCKKNIESIQIDQHELDEAERCYLNEGISLIARKILGFLDISNPTIKDLKFILKFCENRESIQITKDELDELERCYLNKEISLVVEEILDFLCSSNPTYYNLNRDKIDELKEPYSPEKLDFLIKLITNSFEKSRIILRDYNKLNTKDGIHHSVLLQVDLINDLNRVKHLTTDEGFKLTQVPPEKALLVGRQFLTDAMRYQLLLRRKEGPLDLTKTELREKPNKRKFTIVERGNTMKKGNVTIVERPISLKRKE